MDVSQASWIQREKLLIEFDQDWQSQQPPIIEEFIQRAAEFRTQNLLLELIQVDLEYQWKTGNSVDVESYLTRFPELTQDEENCWSLFKAEVTARVIAGALPDDYELKERFGSDYQKFAAFVERSRTPDSPSITQTIVEDTLETHITNGTVKFECGAIVGHYRLIEKIGSGSFSTVWSAHDGKLNRKVAVKILNEERLADPMISRRMMREARAAAQLEHPAIVRVHEVGQHQKVPFIVTQLVLGPTLGKNMDSQRYTFKESADIVKKIAEGIHFAHCDGIVHRDMKPENILMMDRLSPMIVDFGLACQSSNSDIRLTVIGDIMGTPAYMSPEQATGSLLVTDPRTDVYSIGVILFQMLTGKLPFEGSMSTVIHKVVNTSPPSLRSLEPRVSRDLETITLKCMEKSLNDRYSTANELAEDLARFLNDEPIKARPLGNFEKTIRLAQRKPRATALVLSMLVLLGILIGTRLQLNSEVTRNIQNTELLANSERTAGQLAMQRGRFESAVSHFEKSQSLGGMTALSDQLNFVEALVGTRRIDRANLTVTKMETRNAGGTNETDGSIPFWRAMLALEEGLLEDAIEGFEAAIDGELESSDRLFANAMLADNTPQAIKYLERSINKDPTSRHARRMLLWLKFSVGDFDQLNSDLDVTRHLFPEDTDFLILESMLLATETDIAESLINLKRAKLRPEEISLWERSCKTVCNIVETTSHQGNPGDLQGFDDRRFVVISKRIADEVWPAMKSRGLFFPPRITIAFQDYDAKIQSNLDSDEAGRESLEQLCLVHPEPSLQLLLAAQYMQVDYLDIAIGFAEQALEKPGFIHDTSQVALESVSACALSMMNENSNNGVDNSLKLATKFVNAVKQFESDPEIVAKYSQEKYGAPLIEGILLSIEVNACSEVLLEKWLARLEVSVRKIDILWIRTIAARRSKSWVRLIELCDGMSTYLESVDLEDSLRDDYKNRINNARLKAVDEINRIQTSNEISEVEPDK